MAMEAIMRHVKTPMDLASVRGIFKVLEGSGHTEHGLLKRLAGGGTGGDGDGGATGGASELTRLLDAIVATLNVPDDDLGLKEACLELLASLTQTSALRLPVQLALGNLSASFEDFFAMASRPVDAITMARKLQLHVLTLFFRFTGYDLKGDDLLELTAGSIPACVNSLISVFQCATAPADVHVAAAKTLLYLTLPDTYFRDDGADSSPGDGGKARRKGKGNGGKSVNDTAIKELTTRYNRQVNALIRAAMDLPLFDSLDRLLRPWIKHCSRGSAASAAGRGRARDMNTMSLHAFMSAVLHFMTNALLYSSECGRQFRHHVAVKSHIIPDVIVPYLLLTVDAAAAGESGDRRHGGASVVHVEATRLALSVLVVATFRIRVLRQQLRDDNPTRAVLAVPALRRDDLILALLIKLNVNIDFAAPTPKPGMGQGRKARRRRAERMRKQQRRARRGGGGRGSGGARSGGRGGRAGRQWHDDTSDGKDAEPSPDAAAELTPDEESAVASMVTHLCESIVALPEAAQEKLRVRLASWDASSPMYRNCGTFERLRFAFDELHFRIATVDEDDERHHTHDSAMFRTQLLAEARGDGGSDEDSGDDDGGGGKRGEGGSDATGKEADAGDDGASPVSDSASTARAGLSVDVAGSAAAKPGGLDTSVGSASLDGSLDGGDDGDDDDDDLSADEDVDARQLLAPFATPPLNRSALMLLSQWEQEQARSPVARRGPDTIVEGKGGEAAAVVASPPAEAEVSTGGVGVDPSPREVAARDTATSVVSKAMQSGRADAEAARSPPSYARSGGDGGVTDADLAEAEALLGDGSNSAGDSGAGAGAVGVAGSSGTVSRLLSRADEAPVLGSRGMPGLGGGTGMFAVRAPHHLPPMPSSGGLPAVGGKRNAPRGGSLFGAALGEPKGK